MPTAIREHGGRATTGVDANDARAQIIKELVRNDLKPDEREARLRELRQIVAAQDGPSRAEMTLEDKRAEFGVEPKFASKASEANWNYEGEHELLDYAHAQGLGAAVVKEFFNEYVTLREGNEVTPFTDSLLYSMEKKFQARGVPKEVTAKVRRWARERGYA